MGRHSASYIAAQRGLPARHGGAARYVGRVGALALALGIGAAVTGGTGVANADETTGDSGPAASESSGGPGGTATDTATVESPAAESKTSAAPETGGPTPPEMKLGETNSAAAATDSLPGLIVSVPARVASAFLEAAAAGLGAPSTAPGAQEPTRPVRNRGSISTAVADHGTPTASPVETGHGADPPVRNATEAARGGLDPSPTATETATVERSSAATVVAPSAAAAVPAPAAALAPPAPPAFANPIATVVRGVLSALGITPAATSGDAPASPMPLLLGVLQLVHRELERFVAGFAPPSATVTTSAQPAADVANPINPAIEPGVPAATDDAPTPYGDIGKWMLEPNGQISDWGGRPQGGKTLLEAVNVVIVDPNSNSVDEAKWRLACAMFWSGFPAQPIHSGGFLGEIDDVVYGQRPALPLFGYSNNFFLFTNDHGRIFGPDPVETATGYVWSGSFSTEAFTFYGLIPGHSYVSSNLARTALATQLVMSGRATYGGMVPLDNAYNTGTTSTGDHDGQAVVLVLR